MEQTLKDFEKEAEAIKPRFLTEFIRRFRKNRLALLGATILGVLAFMSIFASFISPYNPKAQFVGPRLGDPSPQNLLGTDQLGRDVLSRLIHGTSLTLATGVLAALVASLIGTVLGVISGFLGGIRGSIIMRITDVFLTMPSFFLYILIMSLFRTRSPWMMMLVLGITMWPRLARIVRSECLSLRERNFIVSAKAAGASDRKILFSHLVPNAMAPIIVTTTMNIALAILIMASVSFLGLGDPTVVSWGGMLTVGHHYIHSAWWLATFPGLAIFISVLAFNLIGDGLRDSLDPRLRGMV